MREACITEMPENWNKLYDSVKEGYAGAYNFEGEVVIDYPMKFELKNKAKWRAKY